MNIPNNSVRLITFNILFDYGDEKAYSWKSRKDRAFSLLRFHAPDIFCLQEPLQSQVDDFSKHFCEYDFLSAGCEDGISAGQHMSIFFLKEKFTLLESGKFGLSENPEKLGLVGWDAKNPRLALWTKLSQKSTGKVFFIVCTHLDHKGENARQQGALLLCDRIQKISKEFPVLVCGDFNANTSSKAYKTMTNCEFLDCANVQTSINYNQPYSYHKFLLGKGQEEMQKYEDDPRVLKIIDHIFYKGDMEILRHGILGDNYEGEYPSDHLPKVCDISF